MLVVIAVADEVQNVVVGSPQPTLQGRKGALALHKLDLDDPSLLHLTEGRSDTFPLPFHIKEVVVAGAGDDDQNAQRGRDFQGDYRLRELGVAHGRDGSAQGQVVSHLAAVHELPGQVS